MAKDNLDPDQAVEHGWLNSQFRQALDSCGVAAGEAQIDAMVDELFRRGLRVAVGEPYETWRADARALDFYDSMDRLAETAPRDDDGDIAF